jgi:phosphoribosylaminoimidazolecarboxamide formyltransferase/IMP cyclohydrolase
VKALLSVFRKEGIVELAKTLTKAGIDLVSTGGTLREIASAGIEVAQVSELTGFPELLDGRVKTLHPKVHAGILARRDSPEHMAELAGRAIESIDVIVVNLYPFEDKLQDASATLSDMLENIDIGGPTLLRAAAKNFPSVVVLVDPQDYGWVAEHFVEGTLTQEQRRVLAAKAFQHVALYDTLITNWLSEPVSDDFRNEITFAFRKSSDLRYGENPHQRAALYTSVPFSSGVVGATQLHGKDLSFNNLLDADAAWQAASDFPEETVAVVKHTNTCGIASHPDIAEAYRRAHAGDPTSAYGGIVAFNRPVTAAAAEAMRGVFYEVVIAPDFDEAALLTLQKRRGLRVLKMGSSHQVQGIGQSLRHIRGGVLLQDADHIHEDTSNWSVATLSKPNPTQFDDLVFAWRVAKHIKSNAIVLVKDKALIGMGAGQPNRLISVHLALKAAGDRAQGCVLASDAFFPFADGVELAVNGGVKAVIQPGGSIRDSEVVDTANSAGISMVTTGVRHFLH